MRKTERTHLLLAGVPSVGDVIPTAGLSACLSRCARKPPATSESVLTEGSDQTKLRSNLRLAVDVRTARWREGEGVVVAAQAYSGPTRQQRSDAFAWQESVVLRLDALSWRLKRVLWLQQVARETWTEAEPAQTTCH